jgi:hypothetical protein
MKEMNSLSCQVSLGDKGRPKLLTLSTTTAIAHCVDYRERLPLLMRNDKQEVVFISLPSQI